MPRIIDDNVISNYEYSICGKSYEIHYITGIYLRRGMVTEYDFIRNDIQNNDEYGISNMDLERDIGIQENDRVSIANFGKTGGTFLVYNHRNSMLKHYPESIEDLYWDLKDNFLKLARYFPIRSKLKLASKNFQRSETYHNVLREIKTL